MSTLGDDPRIPHVDLRALIAEGRKHDAAMTSAPWCTQAHGNPYAHICGWAQPHEAEGPFGGISATGPDVFTKEAALCDAAGIAWLRSNIGAILDGCAAALAETERLRTQTHSDAERMLQQYQANATLIEGGEHALRVVAQRDARIADLEAQLTAATDVSDVDEIPNKIPNTAQGRKVFATLTEEQRGMFRPCVGDRRMQTTPAPNEVYALNYQRLRRIADHVLIEDPRWRLLDAAARIVLAAGIPQAQLWIEHRGANESRLLGHPHGMAGAHDTELVTQYARVWFDDSTMLNPNLAPEARKLVMRYEGVDIGETAQ